MNCHTQARKTKPEIIKLTNYYNTASVIPWVRIHRVPEYVYFNHSVHVNKAIDCINCHGDVTRMERVSQMHSFTMGSCIDCHRHPDKYMPAMAGKIENGPENCWGCHR
jgi:formylmethanofuran dehydrogenase subunit B